MGIVKISDLLHDDIRDASKAMSRSVNAQAEYWIRLGTVSYTHLRAHETRHDLVCRLLLEKKKKKDTQKSRMPSVETEQKK